MNAANGSTAIGTTATVKGTVPGTGRFAPSPSGALHLGSLATAAASFLDARHQGGKWLLRIEDLDTARALPAATDSILRALECLGFWWDGPVVYQSQRLMLYRQALDELTARGLAYPCSCTRSDRGATSDSGGYPGTCRLGARRPGPAAMRFRADLCPAGPFVDRLHGLTDFDADALGDPIVRRRDGCFAYQLAVVVDDAAQGVSDVVRGDDLLTSTFWQRSLLRALDQPEPRYAHLPLVCDPDGAKLSKSKRTVSSSDAAPTQQLWRILQLLRQCPPAELAREPVEALWAWAIAHWRLEALRGVATLPAD
ncbi:MAG TPA: tRNA glutamyl-Q(34) synthetase GluQRS [Steroidobacteraceae bacterium]|nr:tRNA glutamyl-Q(34) synthetase GluQRS [Steroidobacteraceae bacterium]